MVVHVISMSVNYQQEQSRVGYREERRGEGSGKHKAEWEREILEEKQEGGNKRHQPWWSRGEMGGQGRGEDEMERCGEEALSCN